jgi:DUF1365 family protein
VNSCLYTASVIHRRKAPVAHAFRYPLALFYLDLDELETLGRSLRLFSVNRPNLTSFHDCDHIDGRPRSTKQKLLTYLRAQGIDLDEGKIFLLTQCRMFGYVFNPVSFYYCYSHAGSLRSIAAEVNNTFGERHLYLLSDRNRVTVPGGWTGYCARKVMHVSPFSSMDAWYSFRFGEAGDRLAIAISQREAGRQMFHARLSGDRMEINDRNLAYLLVRYPLQTLRVIGAIHWQALRLYWKGAPFHRQPAPSAEQHAQLRILQQLRKEAVS